MPTRPIRFIYRGAVQTVQDLPPTVSVLEWLRTQANGTGTKEGCAEGDCGACTVIVAELADDGPNVADGADGADRPVPPGPDAGTARVGALRLRPINACIRFLPTLDGKALLTVEDLASPDGHLHPVQHALVQHHGSQCGFCTPGFAMSIAACREHHRAAGTRPTRAQCADALAGNLCRCTGYRPILDAAAAAFDDPAPWLDADALGAQLRPLQADTPLQYEGPAADGSGRRQRLHAPRRLHALAALRAQQPAARLLAGGTDIGLWVNKQFRDLGDDILYLGDVAALRTLQQTADGTLCIGAAVPLEDAWDALARRWPELRETARRFAGPPVRHAGTLVGNVANGSPIGDSAPVLMALDARLRLRHGERVRELPLDAFYVDYQKSRLASGEFIEAVLVPPAPAGLQLRAWKISKRFDCDISAVLGAFALQLDGDTVRTARLAFGGMAATVRRATGAEAAMCGQAWTEATLHAAQTALDADFNPLSDLRASAAYRRETARALLRRLWLQTRPDAPLDDEHTSIWAQEASA